MYTDDGIVVRLPEADEAPPAESILFEPEEIEDLVVDRLSSSALFASRFRECAARALLLPRRRPDRRTPLWQQRQRSAALLQVAGRYPQFPIVLETYRECLQDVFDVPALVELMAEVQRREVRVVEVDTPMPSPFASSLLFGYVAAFMYEGDAPLAERRAQALSLDRAVLAELMGRAELRELIDGAALADLELELQRLTDTRKVRDADDLHDALRSLGDLTTGDAAARSVGRPRPPRGCTTWRRAGARCRCGWRGRSAGSRPRTPPATGTRSGWRRRRGSPSRCSSRWPIRWATWWRASRGRTGRSCRRTSRSGSDWAPRSSSPRSTRCRNGAASPKASSAPAPPAGSGSTPRCCDGCGAGRWPRCGKRSSRPRGTPWHGSSSPGRASVRRRRRAPTSMRCTGCSSSCRGCPFPRRRSSGRCCPSACRATRRRCSTSCAPPARSCGAARGRWGATTAGWCSDWPTGRTCCCRRRCRPS